MPQQIVGGSGGNLLNVNADGSLNVVGGGGGGGGSPAPGTITKRLTDLTLDPALWALTVNGAGVTYTPETTIDQFAVTMPATTGASFTMTSKATFTSCASYSLHVTGLWVDKRTVAMELFSVDGSGVSDGKWVIGIRFANLGAPSPGYAQTYMTVPGFGGLYTFSTTDFVGTYVMELTTDRAVFMRNNLLSEAMWSNLLPPANTVYKFRFTVFNDTVAAPATEDIYTISSLIVDSFTQPVKSLVSEPVLVQPVFRTNYADSTVFSVDTSQTLAPASPSRQLIRIENLSTVPVFVRFSAGAASTTSFTTVLKACTVAKDGTGGVYVDDMYSGPITAVAASGTGNEVVVVTYYWSSR